MHDLTTYNQVPRSGPHAANNLWRTIALLDTRNPVGGTVPNVQLRFGTILSGVAKGEADPGCLQVGSIADSDEK